MHNLASALSCVRGLIAKKYKQGKRFYSIRHGIRGSLKYCNFEDYSDAPNELIVNIRGLVFEKEESKSAAAFCEKL